MEQKKKNELIWGANFLTEGKEYVVETYRVDTLVGIYKGIYKKREKPIPYVILYDVKKDQNKMAQVTFYRQDKFYDAEQYITELKYKAQQAQQSMEKRALNQILGQLVDENIRV